MGINEGSLVLIYPQTIKLTDITTWYPFPKMAYCLWLRDSVLRQLLSCRWIRCHVEGHRIGDSIITLIQRNKNVTELFPPTLRSSFIDVVQYLLFLMTVFKTSVVTHTGQVIIKYTSSTAPKRWLSCFYYLVGGYMGAHRCCINYWPTYSILWCIKQLIISIYYQLMLHCFQSALSVILSDY